MHRTGRKPLTISCHANEVGGGWHSAWDHANFAPPCRLPTAPTMPNDKEANYTRTDLVVAVILAAIAAAWVLAYIVIFVKSGAA